MKGDLDDFSDLREELDEILADPELVGEEGHTERMARACAVICTAFDRRGLRATVVGGGALELYAPSRYTSGDNDLVVEYAGTRPSRKILGQVFDELGFERWKKSLRHWVRDDFFVEVPGDVLEGEADEFRIGTHTLRVIKREYLLVERLVDWEQTGSEASGLQGAWMLEAFREELDEELLAGLLRKERVEKAHEAMLGLVRSGATIDAPALRGLRDGLRRTDT